LADRLATLIRNPATAKQLGLQGQSVIRERYTAEAMANAHRELYRRTLRQDGHAAASSASESTVPQATPR
jgi:glycosyltransferase involved in cell wall biosynthesis